MNHRLRTKILWLAFVTLIGGVQISAGGPFHFPLGDEDEWDVRSFNPDPGATLYDRSHVCRKRIVGDSILSDGKIYRIMTKTNMSNGAKYRTPELFRTEGQKVYMITDRGVLRIFDFSMDSGDTLWVERPRPGTAPAYWNFCVLHSRQSKTVMGRELMVYDFRYNGACDFIYQFADSLGFYYYGSIYGSSLTGVPDLKLVGAKINGKAYGQRAGIMRIHQVTSPNPSAEAWIRPMSNGFRIHFPRAGSPVKLALFDAFGRRIWGYEHRNCPPTIVLPASLAAGGIYMAKMQAGQHCLVRLFQLAE